MAKGYYGTENSPLGGLHSERVVLTPHTSGEPDQYGMRLRTDLDSGDRIATVLVNNSTVGEAPVFPDGTSTPSGIAEGPPVYVPGEGWGFIPIREQGGAFEEYVIWHDSTRYGVHDSLFAGPDSAVWQFDPATFTTGDAEWQDDVRSNDMSLTGDLQSGTLSNGDPSVVADGTDDHGLATAPSELSGSGLGNGFAIEIAVEFTTSGICAPLALFNSGDGQAIAIFLNADLNLDQQDGNVMARIDDTGDNRLFQVPDSNPGLDDGNRHTIVANYNDPANNDIELIIDGSTEPSSGGTTENPSNFGTWDVDWGYFARNNGGSIDVRYSGALGKIRLHDQTISGPTI